MEKKSSAVPQNNRFGKQYQVIVFATKGERPRIFNKLRIDPPLLVTEKYSRDNGVYITDVWDDIRELTSGYFAGDEPLRTQSGVRIHKQQSPIQLLLRIILSSSNIDDLILDPFAGTATTLVVAMQLMRNSIGIELNPKNVLYAQNRLDELRDTDKILKFRNNYKCTENLNAIWKINNELLNKTISNTKEKTMPIQF